MDEDYGGADDEFVKLFPAFRLGTGADCRYLDAVLVLLHDGVDVGGTCRFFGVCAVGRSVVDVALRVGSAHFVVVAQKEVLFVPRSA